MNKQQYLENRKQREDSAEKHRPLCHSCLQPDITCYCPEIKKFDPVIEFIILIHPLEVRRRVATGRMSHLTLENSKLIHGHNFSKNEMVNEIVRDPSRHCVMLYPGRQASNLTIMSTEARQMLVPPNKKLTVFVIDGTWMTAKKMVRLSQNIKDLPRIAFLPPRKSNFRVRQQPNENCFSTIEAIHHTIELLAPAIGFSLEARRHDALLRVFDSMVEKQLDFIEKTHNNPNRVRGSRHRINSANRNTRNRRLERQF